MTTRLLAMLRRRRTEVSEPAQEREARAQLRVLTTSGNVHAAPQRPPLWVVPVEPPDDRPAA